ncbi:MAG TPA: S53 family peptidase [Verrucomicrobiae bacterium]|nr:S53 family peptidase [Verrucomicrobiae bacterium]
MHLKLLQMACAIVVLSLAPRIHAAERQTLHGHMPPMPPGHPPTGRLGAANTLRLAIGLPLRNRDALTNLFQQMYDPVSTNFHRYLTPEQFTERFGPTAQDYQSVKDFAVSNRLAVVETFDNRVLLDVSGRVVDIEKAFHITLRTYRHPTEQREFYAPDVEPSVEASLAILDISGLDNYILPHPMAHQEAVNTGVDQASGSAPGGKYRGYDFRNAYVAGVTLSGAGQTVGLVEGDGYFTSDIATYESQAGLPNVPIVTVLLDGLSTTPSSNTNAVAEVSLDIEMVISMAPGLTKLYSFEGNIWNDILGRMASSNQIKQFSSSWTFGGPGSTSEQMLQQMGLQGQSFFQASGDGNAYTGAVWWPGDDPYVTSVGGTALTMTGSGAAYASETVWNTGFSSSGPWCCNGQNTNSAYWGSGGGISTTYSIPSWQQGVPNLASVGGSTSKRNLPDVALTATGIWVNYFNGLSGSFQGTSCAAPLWAGFMALVNQQAVGDGKPTIGFLNPALYAIGEGQSYSSCFNDVTNGNNTWPGGSPTKFFAGPGYDLCTGWGTPTANLISALENFAGAVWVDFSVAGPGTGTYADPYNTLALGVSHVGSYNTIAFKGPNSSSVTTNISKPLTMTTFGGPVTIGH